MIEDYLSQTADAPSWKRALLLSAMAKAELLPLPMEVPQYFSVSKWTVTRDARRWFPSTGIFELNVTFSSDVATSQRRISPSFSVDVDPNRVRKAVMDYVQAAVDSIRVELGIIR